MTAGSMAGYSRTPRKEYPIKPNMMIRMEQTIAKTGRLRESSERFMRLLRFGQLDVHARTEEQDSGRDDRIAGLQAAEDLDIGGVPDTGLDIPLYGLPALVYIQQFFPATGNDHAVGHQQCRLILPQQDAHFCEHAGNERRVALLHERAHGQAARTLVDA